MNPQSPFYASVLDHSAKGDGSADDAPAIQSAVDTVIARIATLAPGRRVRGTVHVPDGSYRLDRSIWVDADGVEVVGDGRGSQLQTTWGTPALIFGLSRKTTAERVDSFGILDALAAPYPGYRWGLRTRGRTVLQELAGPLSGGLPIPGTERLGHWEGITQLTVDFAVKGPDGGPMPDGAHILGCGVPTRVWPRPILVYMAGTNLYRVQVGIHDGQQGSIMAIFDLHSGAATGLQRIAFQVDLDRGSVEGYVNGALTMTASTPFDPGRFALAENTHYPFYVGNLPGLKPAYNGVDFTVHGLALTARLRYNPDGSRIDGRPDSDARRYFPLSDEADHVGHIEFNDPPGSKILGIRSGDLAGNRRSAAFLLGPDDSLDHTPSPAIRDNAARHLSLVGSHVVGTNLAIGLVLDLDVIDVTSTDAARAIGSINLGASYVVRVRDCELSGSDCGYDGYDQMLSMMDTKFIDAGRETIRLTGCTADCERLSVRFGNSQCQSFAAIRADDYGGQHRFRNVNIDFEGPTFRRAVFAAEAFPYQAATLRLEDIDPGTVGSVPIVLLEDGFPNARPATLITDGITGTTATTPLVRATGSAWTRREPMFIMASQGIRNDHQGPVTGE